MDGWMDANMYVEKKRNQLFYSIYSYLTAFSKTLSQVLVLQTNKVTENGLPIFTTLDILREIFAFVLGSDDLLTLSHKSKLTEVQSCFLKFILLSFAKIQRVQKILSHIYLPANVQGLSCHQGEEMMLNYIDLSIQVCIWASLHARLNRHYKV